MNRSITVHTDDELRRRKTKPPRWEYLVLAAVLAALAVLALAGMRVADASKEPKKVSDKFVYSILSSNSDEAYALTAVPYRQSTSKEEFKDISSRLDANIRSNPKLADHSIVRNEDGILVATMEYDIPGTDGHKLIVKLVRENQQWTVLNISTNP